MVLIGDRQNDTDLHADRRRPTPSRKRPKARDVSASLPLVMNEICDLMGGDGAMLTLHSGYPAHALFASVALPHQTQAEILAKLTLAIRAEVEDDNCFWRDLEQGCILVMPVEQLAGHGQLLIGIFFEYADADRRHEAERLYRERRPFAIGFFQLWQHNRVLLQRAQSLEAVLDHTAIGLLMLDRSGRIVFENHTADEILSAGDGIGRSNGTLRAAQLVDGVNLQAALSHAIAGDDESSETNPAKATLLAFSRVSGPPLVAAVLPTVSPGLEESDVAAILYLVDPQIDTEKMLAPLCRLYGLSPVETSLVCHLAAGETISSAAQQMRIKEPTARSYLKTIFIKTSTRRQTELVVLMLSSLVRMKRDVLQVAITQGNSARALGLSV